MQAVPGLLRYVLWVRTLPSCRRGESEGVFCLVARSMQRHPDSKGVPQVWRPSACSRTSVLAGCARLQSMWPTSSPASQPRPTSVASHSCAAWMSTPAEPSEKTVLMRPAGMPCCSDSHSKCIQEPACLGLPVRFAAPVLVCIMLSSVAESRG